MSGIIAQEQPTALSLVESAHSLTCCVTSNSIRRCRGSLNAICGGLSDPAPLMSSPGVCDIRTRRRAHAATSNTVYFKSTAFLSQLSFGNFAFVSKPSASLRHARHGCESSRPAKEYEPLPLSQHTYAGDRKKKRTGSPQAMLYDAGRPPCFQDVLCCP